MSPLLPPPEAPASGVAFRRAHAAACISSSESKSEVRVNATLAAEAQWLMHDWDV